MPYLTLFLTALLLLCPLSLAELTIGTATIRDWDSFGDSFSFRTGTVCSGCGYTSDTDFFIASRGSAPVIHVWDSPGVLDLGELSLFSLYEAEDSGYRDVEPPLLGHTYVIRSNSRYGAIRIVDIRPPTDQIPAEYTFEWVYQDDFTRNLAGLASTGPDPTGTTIKTSEGSSVSDTVSGPGLTWVSQLRGSLNADGDCNLYVALYGENRVASIGPDGSATTYVSGIDRPRSQLFDDFGNLYVGSYDGNIYRFSPTGDKTVIASGIWSPQGMGLDINGNLYVACGYDGNVYRISKEGATTTISSGFANPKYLAVSPQGDIYVADTGGSVIVRITLEGGKASLADLGEPITGMVMDGGNLYVSHVDRVSMVDAYGALTDIATGLDQPSHLAVCGSNVFVVVKDGIIKTGASTTTTITSTTTTITEGNHTTTANTNTGCTWTGTWETDWGKMTLEQSGIEVTGTHSDGDGQISGRVFANKLNGRWSDYPTFMEPNDAGDFEFTMSADCNSFDGVWRNGPSGDWSGTWMGTRV